MEIDEGSQNSNYFLNKSLVVTKLQVKMYKRITCNFDG